MRGFNWFYTHHLVGSLMMIIFWAFIILSAIWLFKNISNDNKDGEKRENIKKEDPGEIARRRYAKGEIDKEELKEILNNLENG